MRRTLVRRHPAIVMIAVLSIVGWVVYGFVSGSKSVPFYLAWMIVTSAIVLRLDRRRSFSGFVLAGLTLWAFMHLAGGMWTSDGDVLYARWLLPYLRYDQLTHAIGFGFAGLAVGEQFEPWMTRGTRAASFTIVLIGGLAVGAVNEMLEFLLTRTVSDTNIGGFENTGWDLVANTVGSLFAAMWAAGRSPS